MDSPDYRFAPDGLARLPIRPITDSPDYRFAQMDSPRMDSPDYQFARLRIRPAGFARLPIRRLWIPPLRKRTLGHCPCGIRPLGIRYPWDLLPSGPGIPGTSREQPVICPGTAASSHGVISVGIYAVFCYQVCSRLNMCRKMIPYFFAAKPYTHFGQQDNSMELRLASTLAKADDPKADNMTYLHPTQQWWILIT